jgi:uncharacterized protein YdeI (YjbR/CyaY-like superfamily)
MSLATFSSRQEFRHWLLEHHDSASELIVRCYKAVSKHKGLTYPEALEEALCFGWIDGVRRAIDEDSFSNRFSPRRPGSKWSAVNIKRATELQTAGRMHASGKAAFAARSASADRRYSYETRLSRLAPSLLAELKANRKAWKFFQAQSPWYQRTSSFWVMDAKREVTRERRLAELITRSANGEPIKLLDRRRRAAVK